jgi:hypothetical protein
MLNVKSYCYLLLTVIGASIFDISCAVGQSEDQRMFDGEEWLRPATAGSVANWTAIPQAQVYEVVSSKLLTAVIRDLSKNAIIRLTPDTAQYYTGAYYKCESGRTPFLVRAVYAQGATGRYSVSVQAKSLIVSHSGLGGGGKPQYHKSALIVNLANKPNNVYIEASAAR